MRDEEMNGEIRNVDPRNGVLAFFLGAGCVFSAIFLQDHQQALHKTLLTMNLVQPSNLEGKDLSTSQYRDGNLIYPPSLQPGGVYNYVPSVRCR